jgi:hypothetical protein
MSVQAVFRNSKILCREGTTAGRVTFARTDRTRVGPCAQLRTTTPQRHVDHATLERVVNDLLDVPGNRSFRDTIEMLRRELGAPEPSTQPSAEPAKRGAGDDSPRRRRIIRRD